MRKGVFLVFEGTDGCGKTTQATLLAKRLDANLIPHELTREPDYTGDEGERIKRMLQGKEEIGPLERQELFVKNRAWHVKNVINPSLNKRKVVISDRYFLSTIAYGSSQDIDIDVTMKMNAEFPHPDLIIILDVPVQLALARLHKRNEERGLANEQFETEQLLNKADATYRTLATKYQNVMFVDGTGNEEMVAGRIAEIVWPLIAAKEGHDARNHSTSAAA